MDDSGASGILISTNSPQVISNRVQALRSRLSRSGALLFLIGLLTGLWAGASLGGMIELKNPHLALAAHLNGLLGGLWMIAVAQTLDMLHYGERGLRNLVGWVTLASWANWLLTLVASVLGVSGLGQSPDPANGVIGFCLQLFVVLPSLVGAGVWAWGFRKPEPVTPG